MIQITNNRAKLAAIMDRAVPPMNCTDDVTIELASDGMIVYGSTSADEIAEYYVIRDASLYAGGRNESNRPVPLSRLWAIWFASLPLLAALIYLSFLLLG